MLRTGDDAASFRTMSGSTDDWILAYPQNLADCAGLAPDEGHYPSKVLLLSTSSATNAKARVIESVPAALYVAAFGARVIVGGFWFPRTYSYPTSS